ncbi:polynucleotide adenylyltransferase PcnB [Legionella sp. MW5194]|uniref:polynucleotide adenylyltransferase PcnB n=1 Tax=Legionella sp. MW5194 TaxID=2662448 RepID=UPI00193DE7AA|nr:polynucleotide adenylyltransferase PcnB [Legionella sp. MW5194]QRN05112.1 polynucleotide adenylyltransferase PcnB [Legionella sp. MW5194]
MLRKTRTKHVPVNASYIIPRNHHHLSKTDISPNALKVLNRLSSSGFEAYLVGGSVRDLLLGKSPKDFDVATNATPVQIKKLFRNARIIGRRFKLVHIIFHRDIIEVATFRGTEAMDANQQTNEQGMLVRDNVYGTLDQDAWRRDFTINSLYYNMDDASIVDFTGGVKDVSDRLVRMIGDPTTRYQEDPVRMLRAIRFCAKLHFNMAPETSAPLAKLSPLIRHVSGSRLFDEMTKLYQCGESESVQRLLQEHGLFAELFEQTHRLLNSDYPVNALLGIALESTDARIRDSKPVTPAFLFAVLLWFPLKAKAMQLQQEENIPALPALERAMNHVIAEQNKVIAIPKRFTQVMREMWLLQFRFNKRHGGRALNLLEHPRFRAAFDFLALRALAGDESMELAQWWTTFQDAPEDEQTAMIAALAPPPSRKPKRRRKPKTMS